MEIRNDPKITAGKDNDIGGEMFKDYEVTVKVVMSINDDEAEQIKNGKMKMLVGDLESEISCCWHFSHVIGVKVDALGAEWEEK